MMSESENVNINLDEYATKEEVKEIKEELMKQLDDNEEKHK